MTNEEDRKSTADDRPTKPRGDSGTRIGAWAGKPLASELGGDLPCVRCRYNLKGLSIRALCPECGTPLGATLLAVVDPKAAELQPIKYPKLTALGVVIWSVSALIASLCQAGAWIVAVASQTSSAADPGSPLRLSLVGFVALSGIGAAALVRPHDGISRRGVTMALLGVGLYVPLTALAWWAAYRPAVPVLITSPGQSWYFAPTGNDALAGIAIDLLLMAILVLLRPNGRLLVARSQLMRSGRVDRQTMRAVAFVLLLNVFGNYIGWMVAAVPQPKGKGSHIPTSIRPMIQWVWENAPAVGGLCIVVGCMFFLVGLVGIVVDSLRMRGVIASPPLSFSDLLGPGRAGVPERPSRDFVR